VLQCEGLPVPVKQSGVNELIERGQFKTFSFKDFPATSECLQQVSIMLQSSFAYNGRPVVFAQGNDGFVVLRLPLPSAMVPVASPVSPPVAAPTQSPVVAPTSAPIRLPTAAPVTSPVTVPTLAPTTSPVVVSTVVVSTPVQALAPAPMNVPDATAFFVDADPTSGQRFSLTRSTTFSSVRTNIAGTLRYRGGLFRQHRWRSGGFTYTISGFTPGSTQAISLGFAETYQPNCGIGKRVFSVAVVQLGHLCCGWLPGTLRDDANRHGQCNRSNRIGVRVQPPASLCVIY
jgi:hypothetical protein